ncbi:MULTISPECIES: DUF3421 domain-containing protein [unclassified Coleofasciculus]|uniref:DUF3421 domain-containing protein n=1 Tax=Cyanophyceae TaxID=3028117 RepID=UPI0016829D70|nr:MULTISPECIES: DUF3421 domain-containing protein [unclassified Coleofasciculus]MBD1881581.1 DUF3421 domain-containing protein [Coleofasciculus sp. FACHB-T130]MBD1893533.1 DUF3421 domain-containing protein [Coleofasciculus sp. FACHB-129]
MLANVVRATLLSFLPATLLLASSSAILAQNNSGYEALNWVGASNGDIPPNAVIGGSESGRRLYICRAEYNGGVHPGKVVGNNCNFGWGGEEILAPFYEVLTAPRNVRIVWIEASNGRVPAGAIAGGIEADRDLFICRASHNKGVHPGKIVASNCNISWGGQEILKRNYQVAVLRRNR